MRRLAVAMTALLPLADALARDRSQSRSTVSSVAGIVASESVLASQVGASILEQGGNAGRKRPLHTIIPAFMERGDVKIAFGIMGGWNQAQAHAQFVSNVVDFNMNIQAALDAPRFSKETSPAATSTSSRGLQRRSARAWPRSAIKSPCAEISLRRVWARGKRCNGTSRQA